MCATVGALSCLAFPGVQAQQPGDIARERVVGLVAGAYLSPVSASFNHASSESNGGVAVTFGARFNPAAIWCGSRGAGWCSLSRFQVTPHLAYGATHARGLSDPSEGYAFAFLDLPGLKLTYQLLDSFPLTLSVITRRGRHTAERFEQGDVSNYWTMSGRTFGFGIEIPLARSGRGIEIAILRQSGVFDSVETRNAARDRKVISGAALRYRAVRLQVGWSGPFTGVSLPWR